MKVKGSLLTYIFHSLEVNDFVGEGDSVGCREAVYMGGLGEGTLLRSSHQTRDNEKASVGGQQSLPRSSTRCIKLSKNGHILCQIVYFMTYLWQRHYLDFKARRFKRKKAEEHAQLVVRVTRKDLKVVDPGNPLNPTCPALGCSGKKVGGH